MGILQLLPNMPSGSSFDDGKLPRFSWVQWLQSLSDLLSRPLLNRVVVSTNALAVNLNGASQSTGLGTAAVTPVRYGEFLVQARVTFNLSANGGLFVYVYRTKGAVPANGAAPNVGDVIVGGDAFAGPATVGGQSYAGTLSFFDTGLLQSQAYKYYFAVNGTNALVGNLLNNSTLQVSEL
jgi:hypothetical protein